MDISITGRNFDLDNPLKTYVHKRAGKMERLYSRIYKCEVILEETKPGKNAEVILHLKNSRVIAKESSLDMYASIDNAFSKVKKQLRRLHDRASSRRRKAMFKSLVSPMDFFRKNTETDMPLQEEQIIKMKAFADKPMLPEEARLELDVMKRNFMMFKNADTGEVNVLYKRNDGKCGLIEPSF